jgi:hypothetical protein
MIEVHHFYYIYNIYVCVTYTFIFLKPIKNCLKEGEVRERIKKGCRQ